MDEIIRPDLIGAPRTNPLRLSQRLSPGFTSFCEDLQLFPPPNALHPFPIHFPAFGAQKFSDHPISIPRMFQAQHLNPFF
jgi:hypothetical protein